MYRSPKNGMVFSHMRVNKFDNDVVLNDFSVEYESLAEDPELRERVESFITSLSGGFDDLITQLLTELRAATNADAGSIYVLDKGILRFVYVQNDTLGHDISYSTKSSNPFIGNCIPINDHSICGYVAHTKKPLIIGDVRNLPSGLPFTFNDEFDKKSGYTTVSVIASPIFDEDGELVGVLQLINHKEEDGEITTFEDWMLGYVLLLVDNFLPMISISFDRFRDFERKFEDGTNADDMYNEIIQLIRTPCINKKLPWLAACGASWRRKDRYKESNISKRLLSFAHYINQFEDLNTIMDLMLTEARDATGADAGTFYLVEKNSWLRFAYVQNETLFADNSHHHIYVNSEIPINNKSISGYVALERKILNIPDVEDLKENSEIPYSFNRSYDKASGYHTVSMLTVPILGAGNKTIAVLQLINNKEPSGQIIPFDDKDVRYAELLSGQTMPYLVRSIMTKRLIENMLRMSNLHDPKETAGHVNRVGAYAAEIYHKWAENKKIPTEEIRVEKDILHLAAMLHDIGKVSIPDAILKKPDKLTDEEYSLMKTHCAKGASIYSSPDSRLEQAAYEITMHHHQRWDGKGYTGDPNTPALAGEDIPLYARITSVADVFDALVSKRIYKSSWTLDDALEELKKCAGTQFDPEIVEAAAQISGTLAAIKERFEE